MRFLSSVFEQQSAIGVSIIIITFLIDVVAKYLQLHVNMLNFIQESNELQLIRLLITLYYYRYRILIVIMFCEWKFPLMKRDEANTGGMIMFNIVGKIMNAARKYTVLDYGFFKFLMITFGILLGVYFKQPLLNFIWLIWTIFVVSAIWMTYKIFKYTK